MMVRGPLDVISDCAQALGWDHYVKSVQLEMMRDRSTARWWLHQQETEHQWWLRKVRDDLLDRMGISA